jgi:hypothetical protein
MLTGCFSHVSGRGVQDAASLAVPAHLHLASGVVLLAVSQAVAQSGNGAGVTSQQRAMQLWGQED